MLPVIALVGRPNVGKSTLFNSLTRTRNALVADLPGLTRDRQYGIGQRGPRPYVVVDTGGSVSYTHLDVYKRQPIDRRGKIFAIGGMGVSVRTATLLLEPAGWLLGILGGAWIGASVYLATRPAYCPIV